MIFVCGLAKMFKKKKTRLSGGAFSIGSCDWPSLCAQSPGLPSLREAGLLARGSSWNGGSTRKFRMFRFGAVVVLGALWVSVIRVNYALHFLGSTCRRRAGGGGGKQKTQNYISHFVFFPPPQDHWDPVDCSGFGSPLTSVPLSCPWLLFAKF